MSGTKTCPKCGRRMRVLNTYPVNADTTVKSLKCNGELGCGASVVTQETILAIDPDRGNGAGAVVSRLRSVE
jgi:hypothetical protein